MKKMPTAINPRTIAQISRLMITAQNSLGVAIGDAVLALKCP
jgi:hypothetical protein